MFRAFRLFKWSAQRPLDSTVSPRPPPPEARRPRSGRRSDEVRAARGRPCRKKNCGVALTARWLGFCRATPTSCRIDQQEPAAQHKGRLRNPDRNDDEAGAISANSAFPRGWWRWRGTSRDRGDQRQVTSARRSLGETTSSNSVRTKSCGRRGLGRRAAHRPGHAWAARASSLRHAPRS